MVVGLTILARVRMVWIRHTWRAVRHVGRHGCRGIAFYVRPRVRPGDIMCSRDAVLPDGTHPDVSSPVVCGTCGLPVRVFISLMLNVWWSTTPRRLVEK